MSIEFYVASDGRDTYAGTEKRPFATLARARDALRALPVAERAGSTVWIGAGDYPQMEALRLGRRDGGRADAPVTWRALPGQQVRLLGGRVVSGFTPVTDPDVLARLAPVARRRVRQLDLKSLGIGPLSPMRSRAGQMRMPMSRLRVSSATPQARVAKTVTAVITVCWRKVFSTQGTALAAGRLTMIYGSTATGPTTGPTATSALHPSTSKTAGFTPSRLTVSTAFARSSAFSSSTFSKSWTGRASTLSTAPTGSCICGRPSRWPEPR